MTGKEKKILALENFVLVSLLLFIYDNNNNKILTLLSFVSLSLSLSLSLYLNLEMDTVLKEGQNDLHIWRQRVQDRLTTELHTQMKLMKHTKN